jgi:hypothetical protein
MKPRIAVIRAERLALRRQEAAEALGVSDETFDRHIRPYLPVVRIGSVRIYPVRELRDYLSDNASAPLEHP